MKRYVLGDIHGEIDALREVLQKVNFDYENDLLIQIGDLMDRGPEPFLCVDELLKVKNLILIRGNHDAAFQEYIETKYNPLGFYSGNGVQATLDRWKELPDAKKKFYYESFFKRQVNYYQLDKMLFVHGGILPDKTLEETPSTVFQWDRELLTSAVKNPDEKVETLYKDLIDTIFIGHTPTLYFGSVNPFKVGGIVNVDTGCGKGGPLTIMNIDDITDYHQSSFSFETLEEYGFIKKTEKTAGEEEEETTEGGNLQKAAA